MKDGFYMFKSFSGKRQPEYDYNLGYIKNEDYMPFFIPIDNENKLRFDKVRIYPEGNKIKDERLWRNEKDIITSIIDLTYVQDKLLNPEYKHRPDLVNAICIGFGFNYQEGEFFDVEEYGNDLSIMPFDKFIGIESITIEDEFNKIYICNSLGFLDRLGYDNINPSDNKRLTWIDINDKGYYAALSWESSSDIIYDNYTNNKKSIVR